VPKIQLDPCPYAQNIMGKGLHKYYYRHITAVKLPAKTGFDFEGRFLDTRKPVELPCGAVVMFISSIDLKAAVGKVTNKGIEWTFTIEGDSEYKTCFSTLGNVVSNLLNSTEETCRSAECKTAAAGILEAIDKLSADEIAELMLEIVKLQQRKRGQDSSYL